MSGAIQPPTPDGVPLLGHGLAFARGPWEAMREWGTRGDVVRLEFPGRTQYMVTDPDLVQSVLVERDAQFTISEGQRQSFAGLEDDAVTMSEGDRWKRLRRALQPAFTWDGIRRYDDRITAVTAEHVDQWDDGQELDLLSETRVLALHILGETLLGVDTTGDEAVVHNAADALVDKTDFRRPGQLLPGWVPTPTDRRFDRAVGRLNDYVAGIVDESDPGDETVAGVLLSAEERGDVSRSEVHDNMVAMLLAGHDSSAVTLTYALLELSRHPETRDRLAEEVASVVDGERPTTEDFDDLELTRAVVNETLRLYPPAFATTREATEPVVLDGYELPAAAQLMMPQWVIHRDERYWDDPEVFDPDRWERDVDRPEYAFFPFSGGPRHCIGMRFARLELVLALAMLADRVELDVTVDGPLTFTPSISLRPETDLTATVSPR